MKYSIVIPAYNEEVRILKTLNDYYNYFKGGCGSFEIIVVCDGCTDKTTEIVKKFGRKRGEINLLIFKNRLGKGGGVLEGFRVADGDIIGFTDADGSISAGEFEKIIESIDNYDCAIGSRVMDRSKILVKQSLSRKILGRGFIIYVNLLFNLGLKDTQCGAKVFKKYVIKNMLNGIKISGFSFDVEILYKLKLNGYKINEVPIKWINDKDSKVKIKHVFDMLLTMLKLRFFG